MGAQDWYRNSEWSAEIEQSFDARLERASAGKRAQFLRIQAAHISETRPDIVLTLLERYFAESESEPSWDVVAAHQQRAAALLDLERLEDALDSFRAALKCESGSAMAVASSLLEFPFLIATLGRVHEYDEALEVLARYDEALFVIPVWTFFHRAALALILGDRGDAEGAVRNARAALRAARATESGLQYHAESGLVGPEHDGVVRRLEQLLESAAD